MLSTILTLTRDNRTPALWTPMAPAADAAQSTGTGVGGGDTMAQDSHWEFDFRVTGTITRISQYSKKYAKADFADSKSFRNPSDPSRTGAESGSTMGMTILSNLSRQWW